MKYNDLMIGDWVIRNKGKESEVRQITGLVKGEVYYSATFEDTSLLFYVSYLQPVPLTPVILAESGFERIDRPGYASSFVLNEYFHWCNGFIFAHKYNDPDTCYFSIPCSYVHQLQNFLKVLKIEKEIKL